MISNIRKLGLIILPLTYVVFATGCATTVQRGTISRDAPLTTGLDINDLRTIVEEMANSMILSPNVTRVVDSFKQSHPQGLPPVLVQGPLQNKTQSRIDLNVVNNKLRATLINSGQFQVLDRRNDAAMIKEMDYQQRGGVSSSAAAPQLGQQMNAQYQLTTELIEVRTERGRQRDVTYSVKMELIQLQTGFTVWINEMEVGKSQKRALLGV